MAKKKKGNKKKAESPIQAVEGFTKMRFSSDASANGKILYKAGEVVDVPIRSVDRWLKRGGVIIRTEEDLKEVEERDKQAQEKRETLEPTPEKGNDDGKPVVEPKFVGRDEGDDEGEF